MVMQNNTNDTTHADLIHLRGVPFGATSEVARKSSYNLSKLESLAYNIARKLQEGKIKSIGLNGPLGAGKTTFVQLLARALGYKGSVTSPTFTLSNEYQCPQNILVHFDLYRVNKSDRDVLEMIKESLLSERWVVLEWSDRMMSINKKLDLILNFRHGKSADERIIEEQNG